MNEFVNAYIEFLQISKEFIKPLMPKFNVSAYTESEYVKAINEINLDYEFIDDLTVTEHFLKGD
jgi:hypothetical protein